MSRSSMGRRLSCATSAATLTARPLPPISSLPQPGSVRGRAPASGFFAADTRFLSRLVLTVDGHRAQPVSVTQPAPHLATFELRGPDGLSVRRELFVGQGLEETVTIENLSGRELEAVVALEVGSDFAD